MAFKKAVKFDSKLRMALTGPSGSGKTYSALAIATAMGGKIALIDTERGSASKYADIFEFDVCELESFHPRRYIDAIQEAEAAGYDIVIIDSLSHAWMGKDGALELVDRAAKASKSQNSYVAWRDITPLQNALVDTMIGARAHIIATLRTKNEYAQEKDDRGKIVIHKVGLAPVQRDGLEHEFDILGELDYQNTLMVSKSRCSPLQGAVIEKPGKEVADILLSWLKGEKPPEISPQQPKAAPSKSGSSPSPRQTNGNDASFPSLLQQLRAFLAKEGIAERDYASYLVQVKILPEGKDLSMLEKTILRLITNSWPKRVQVYREWVAQQAHPEQDPNVPLDEPFDQAQDRPSDKPKDEPSGEPSDKLASAEALAPRVKIDVKIDERGYGYIERVAELVQG